MSRILYIHWNESEAGERAMRLRKAGHRVQVHFSQQGKDLREVVKRPPEAILIDLDRLPSHGRAAATWFRRQKPTRHVPIVFVGGEPDRIALAREVLPDAAFTGWKGIRAALKKAIARPPADPVVPGTMDGYASTPLPKKLGIRAGFTVALLGAPKGFEQALGSLPDDVRFKRQARGRADLALLFVRKRAELERRFPSAGRLLEKKGSVWIAWPKKASGVASDLDQRSVRAFGLAASWVDYKVCAIDETWSGLLFTRRKQK
jgi:hypothetical protein